MADLLFALASLKVTEAASSGAAKNSVSAKGSLTLT
ncbi:hypothetical protein JOE50_003237 [Bradyrhizobium japonicum]|jgi:hypothetical protein|nr:hypothetical protein [Bradyrhizobium japonicum]